MNRQQKNALIIILTSYLVILLDISIVITGLPEIQKSLGFSQIGLSWVQNAYTLAFGGFLLLGARAGDLLGRKRMFILGVSLFTLASFAIGVAQSAAWMIIARGIQGASAAVLAPSTLALLSVYFKEGKERVKALSYYAATAGIGATLGLVLGGIFAGWLSWRVGFFLNVPIGLLVLWAAKKLLVETEKHGGQFDLIGAVSSTLGMAALIYGIIHSGEAGWDDSVTLGFFLGGVLLLAGFIWHESRAAQPLLPLRLFTNKERLSAYIARMLFLGTMVSFFFFSTQFMQNVLHFTPVEAGLGFVPMTVATFVASLMVPKLTHRFGNQGMAILALSLTTIGMFMLSQLTAQSAYWSSLVVAMVIVGLGNGSALGPLTISGVAGVLPEDTGAASGLVNVAHQLGGTLGLSILVVIYASSYQEGVSGVDLLAHQITTGFSGCTLFSLMAVFVMLLMQSRCVQKVRFGQTQP